MSCPPDLIDDAEQNDRERAPDKPDYLRAIVSDDGDIVLDAWIAIEELMAPAKDEESDAEKDDCENGERHAQGGHASLFDRRQH
jgi:hypothetical protein